MEFSISVWPDGVRRSTLRLDKNEVAFLLDLHDKNPQGHWGFDFSRGEVYVASHARFILVEGNPYQQELPHQKDAWPKQSPVVYMPAAMIKGLVTSTKGGHSSATQKHQFFVSADPAQVDRSAVVRMVRVRPGIAGPAPQDWNIDAEVTHTSADEAELPPAVMKVDVLRKYLPAGGTAIPSRNEISTSCTGAVVLHLRYVATFGKLAKLVNVRDGVLLPGPTMLDPTVWIAETYANPRCRYVYVLMPLDPNRILNRIFK